VPIIAKLTGVPLVAAATRIALGERLADMVCRSACLSRPDFVAVKFRCSRSPNCAKSKRCSSRDEIDREVLGIDDTYAGALLRGLIGAGIPPPPPGGRILLSVSDAEKHAATSIAEAFVELGYEMFATPGTWQLLSAAGYPRRG